MRSYKSFRENKRKNDNYKSKHTPAGGDPNKFIGVLGTVVGTYVRYAEGKLLGCFVGVGVGVEIVVGGRVGEEVGLTGSKEGRAEGISEGRAVIDT